MTLIAALPIFGQPVIIGDLLITQAGREAGFRRKTVRVCRNLAIAWTGSELAAMIVADLLITRFSSGHVTRSELDNALTSISPGVLQGLEVTLVGWLIEDKQHCFLWRSDYPSEVFTSDHYIMGSGHDIARGKLGRGHQALERMTSSTPAERGMEALKMALFHCGMLTSDEVGPRRNRSNHGFGHFFEVAAWDGDDFRFVTDATYLYTGVIMSADGSDVKHEALGRVLRYRQEEEHAIVEDRNYQEVKEWVSVARPIAPNPTPPLSEKASAIVSGVHRLPLGADFIVIHTLAFRHPELFTPPAVMVFHKDDVDAISSLREVGDPPGGFDLRGGARYAEAEANILAILERDLRAGGRKKEG